MPIIYDKWVNIRLLVHCDHDWAQFYYDGQLMDDPAVADHAFLGGGQKMSAGVFGTGTGLPTTFAAVDLYSNKAGKMFWDDLTLREIHRGTQSFGQPSPRDGLLPEIYANSAPTANNFTFQIEGSGPRNATGFLGIGLARIAGGQNLGDFTLYINPNPALILWAITSDATGYTTFGAPLLPAQVRLDVDLQHVWNSASGASASGSLHLLVR